jgi:hypothetical protein
MLWLSSYEDHISKLGLWTTLFVLGKIKKSILDEDGQDDKDEADLT